MVKADRGEEERCHSLLCSITHLSSAQRISGKYGEDDRHKCVIIYEKDEEMASLPKAML